MHKIDHVIVREGKVILTGLPFADGQTVTISVVGEEPKQRTSLSIHEVRQALKGGVERFADPCEPMIPPEQWEMLIGYHNIERIEQLDIGRPSGGKRKRA